MSQDTHGESLLVFNPKEEAILDHMPNLKFSFNTNQRQGSSEANLMREALEHMNHKNDTLSDELTETRKLLKLHK